MNQQATHVFPLPSMKTNSLVAIVGVLVLLSVGAWSALKGRFSARKSSRAWPRRPLPDVTQEDVGRIVRRDFPAAQFHDVIAILGEFDNKWESTRIRVRLAALKLADGNLDAVKKQMAFANQDYRDVIVAAAYPGYWKATPSVRELPRKLSKKERQQIIDADWNQYQDWLRK